MTPNLLVVMIFTVILAIAGLVLAWWGDCFDKNDGDNMRS